MKTIKERVYIQLIHNKENYRKSYLNFNIIYIERDAMRALIVKNIKCDEYARIYIYMHIYVCI